MRSLFLKIFFWFWLATILVFAVSIAFDLWHRHEREPQRRRGLSSMLAFDGELAAREWQRGGAPALEAFYERLRKAVGLRAVLLDEHDQELGGQPVPAGAAEVAARVRSTGEFEVQHTETRLLAGTAINISTTQPCVFIAELTPRSPMREIFGNPTAWLAPIGAAIVVGGLICYGLARYLTAPVRYLRAATRQLGGGDLTVRVGPRIGRRRDEIGDLGRDFDFMAERLEALVSAERRLLRDISHELRSPLARLSVALGLARQHAPSEAAQPLDRIELESERLNELIGQLLTLTRLESGAQPPESGDVQLGELLRDVAADADFEAASRNRHVRVDTCQDCVVRGTEALLRSAIENVLRNAIRHTAEGTEVMVNLRHVSSRAVVDVQDHGPGVPESALDDIFRPFYRVADARDRATGGAGLGLAITQRAVQLHGGSISAHNAAGGGLIVRIELPCAPGAGSSQGGSA